MRVNSRGIRVGTVMRKTLVITVHVDRVSRVRATIVKVMVLFPVTGRRGISMVTTTL